MFIIKDNIGDVYVSNDSCGISGVWWSESFQEGVKIFGCIEEAEKYMRENCLDECSVYELTLTKK